MKPTVFGFRKGQLVPQWLEAVQEFNGELIKTDMQFYTDGKLAMVGSDAYMWPTKRHYRAFMGITKRTDTGEILCNATIHGGGVSGNGEVYMFDSASAARKAHRAIKNSVRTKPLPDQFDRYEDVKAHE